MDAEHFPITTPYGQVAGYELNNGWHRGEDRAMPMDTPVLVNGHEIGLSGNSGQVTGPHLHIGRFVGGGDTAPNGGGFHFDHAVVTEVSEDPVNGKFVRVQAAGASWVYLHLSRQSVAVGQELVAATPAAPPTPASYAITESYPDGKQIKLNKQPTHLWGMNYHLDYMKDHPVETHNQGEIWTVTNKVHHENGYDYYRRDGQVDGFNVLDCDDYTPPLPPAYIPPAAPVPIKLAPKVTLVTDIPYYGNSTTARTKYKEAGQLKAGVYYQIRTDNGMWNLSTDNTKNLQQWVNPKDNVVPAPVVAPALPVAAPRAAWQPTLSDADKTSFRSFNPNREPVRFLMEYDYTFTDLNGYSNKAVKRRQYDEVDFSGTFFHDNREWARVFMADNNGNLDMNRWFAIPMINPRTHTAFIVPEKEVYNPVTTPAERIGLNHPTPYDKFIQLGANIDLLYSKAIKTIDGVFRPKK